MTARSGGAASAGGRLLVVATPLGNLSDITLRAREALGRADLVVCEDTRRTRKLLSHLGISTPLRSHHKFNEAATLGRLVRLLGEGRTLALVSDAGTPGLSDPGSRLVAAARETGAAVEAVPGPSALAAALSVSGFPAPGCHFAGYLPARAPARRRFLKGLRAMEAARAGSHPGCEPWPLVFYEAPHRITVALPDLVDALGDRKAVLIREMTKLHEETLEGRLSGIRAALGDDRLRGEITVVVEGSVEPLQEPGAPQDLEGTFRRLEEEIGRKEALRRLARMTGRSRRELYRELFGGRRDEED